MIIPTLLQTLPDLLAVLPAQIPNPSPVQPPGTDGLITVMGWIKWIGYIVAVIGIIVAAIMMFVSSRRGEGGEHMGRLGWIFGGIILIGCASGLVGTFMGA